MTLDNCPICKKQEFLYQFGIRMGNSVEICDNCLKLIKKEKEQDVKIMDLMNSLGITRTWIEDYTDKPKMIASFNNRLRELSEELWITLYHKDDKKN